MGSRLLVAPSVLILYPRSVFLSTVLSPGRTVLMLAIISEYETLQTVMLD